jgi:hypothetical protein
MHVSQAGYPGGPPAVVALTFTTVLSGACPPNLTMTMSLSYGPVHTFVLF